MTNNVTNQKVIKKTNHETFSYHQGDTTYVMQKYFLVFVEKRKKQKPFQRRSC
jgi:hypothetical protein